MRDEDKLLRAMTFLSTKGHTIGDYFPQTGEIVVDGSWLQDVELIAKAEAYPDWQDAEREFQESLRPSKERGETT